MWHVDVVRRENIKKKSNYVDRRLAASATANCSVVLSVFHWSSFPAPWSATPESFSLEKNI